MSFLHSWMPEGWQHRQTKEGNWFGEEAWLQRMLDETGLVIPENEAKVIKQAPHRTIWKLQLDTGTAYLKNYPGKWGFKSNKAIKECKNLVTLANILPLPKPLLCGTTSDGKSWLLSQEVTGMAFDQFWLHPENTQADKDQVLENLAKLIQTMDRSRVFHNDFHPGNILVLPDKSLCLLDAVELRHSLFVRDGWWIALYAWLSHHTTLPYRMDFAFRIVTPELDMGEVELDALRDKLDVWKDRASRALKTNREFYQHSSSLGQGWVARSLSPETIETWLQQPDAAFDPKDAVILKQSKSSTVAKIQLPDGRKLLYKRFDALAFKDRVRRSLHRSPARHCHRMAYMLETAYLPTAKPLAALHPNSNSHSYLVTEYLDDAVSLMQYIRHHSVLPLIQPLADALRKLHEYQLSHRDLKADNLLVRDECGKVKFYFIDLVGVKEHSNPLSFSRRCKDLSRLLVSFQMQPGLRKTDALRFLRYYLETDFPNYWKWCWREVAQLAQDKIAQNTRRGRPIA